MKYEYNPEKPIFLPLCHNGSGSVMVDYMADSEAAFHGRLIHRMVMGDSHADRQCNKMANAFMKTGCDFMIIVDADIRYRKQDIDRLVSHGLPLVYGLYPKKQEDDTRNGKESPPCICTFNEIDEPDENGLVKVRRSGRGFMLVHRDVFEGLKEENGGPALRYHNHGCIEWAFFRSGVVSGELSNMTGIDEDGYPIREWISEDWFLCEDVWRYLSIPTMVDTHVALGHIGAKTFRFGASQLCRMDSNITSWKEIHGWFDFEPLYRKLVALIPDNGRFTEVGCWLGKSVGAFHAFAKEAGKHIAIEAVDTFTGIPACEVHAAILATHGGSVERPFRENMKALGLNGELTVWPIPSTEAADHIQDGSMDAVFIDADHTREAVERDISAWLPKVKPGGILAGHDVDEEGVSQAVAASGLRVEIVGRCWVHQVPA